MEKSGSSRGGVWLLCGFFMLSLLIWSTNADEEYEKKYHPLKNVKLPPFMQSISIYQCMLNISDKCQPEYNLTESGWLNVTNSKVDSFCNLGCADHTMSVLECIFLVKQDYKFADGNSVQDLNYTITQGCIHGGFPLNATFPLPNSAMRASGRAGFGIVFSVVAAVLMTYSHM